MNFSSQASKHVLADRYFVIKLQEMSSSVDSFIDRALHPHSTSKNSTSIILQLSSSSSFENERKKYSQWSIAQLENETIKKLLKGAEIFVVLRGSENWRVRERERE